MKKIKIFIFLCLIFILSGCSVEYNLTINEDGSISEKVIATETTNRMNSNTGLKGEQSVNYLYDMFKRTDENIKMTHRSDGNKTYATVTNSLKDIEEYQENFTSDVFNGVDVTKKDGVVTLIFNQSKKLGGNANTELIYDEIIVNINIPYKVIENNADSVDGDTYTWNIKKNEGLKTLKISYEEGSKTDSLNIKINDKTYNIHYGLIVVSVIIVLLLILILVVFIKNKKNNVV